MPFHLQATDPGFHGIHPRKTPERGEYIAKLIYTMSTDSACFSAREIFVVGHARHHGAAIDDQGCLLRS